MTKMHKIWCLKYKEDVHHIGWSDHCSRRHPVNGSDDADERKDDDADRPGHRTAGVGDAVSTRKKPKHGYGKKEAEGAAPKRRPKNSSGDQGTA